MSTPKSYKLYPLPPNKSFPRRPTNDHISKFAPPLPLTTQNRYPSLQPPLSNSPLLTLYPTGLFRPPRTIPQRVSHTPKTLPITKPSGTHHHLTTSHCSPIASQQCSTSSYIPPSLLQTAQPSQPPTTHSSIQNASHIQMPHRAYPTKNLPRRNSMTFLDATLDTSSIASRSHTQLVRILTILNTSGTTAQPPTLLPCTLT